jgi:hypothetical protein
MLASIRTLAPRLILMTATAGTSLRLSVEVTVSPPPFYTDYACASSAFEAGATEENNATSPSAKVG